jgi:hypothetical protein
MANVETTILWIENAAQDSIPCPKRLPQGPLRDRSFPMVSVLPHFDLRMLTFEEPTLRVGSLGAYLVLRQTAPKQT